MPAQPMTPPGPKPPETILPDVPEALQQALQRALDHRAVDERRAAIAQVIVRDPTYLDAWAALSEIARDDVEGYAAARVGYHRGLDALRANGWKGSGEVTWMHESNRGFLRCLAALAARADAIGEQSEQERCELFLRQLDRSWPPAALGRT